MAERGEGNTIDQLFMEADSWGREAESRKLTPLQRLKKMAGPAEILLSPPSLQSVLDLPTETPDPVDNWQTFAMYKAHRTFNTPGRLTSAPVSLTANQPMAVGPTGDSLMKLLELESPAPSDDPVLAKLAKLQNDNPERWGGVRIPPGPGCKILEKSTSEIFAEIAAHVSGGPSRFASSISVTAKEWGL